MQEIRAAAKRAQDANATPLYGGDPRYIYPANIARATYNEILNTYADAPDDLSIQQGIIRSEAVLSVAGGTQNILFNVRSDQANPTNAIRSTERRLDIRDSFVVTSMSVQFGNELIAASLPATLVPQTWPNPETVAAAPLLKGGLGANAPGVMQCYNGVLQMLVNTVQYIDGIDCLNFLEAGQAQMGQLIFTASNQDWNQGKGKDMGFFEITPNMNIWGSDKVQLNLALPDPFTFSAVALNRVVAVLMLRGFKIQGGAAYK